MLDVNSWSTATVSALIYPKGVRSGPGQSGSSTPNTTIHVFMVLSLCIGVQSCGNRKGPSPNCSIKDGNMMPRIPWYAEALSSFHWNSGAETTPPQPPDPHPHPTLHLAQSSQTSTVLLAATKPRLGHQISRQRRVTLENTSPLLWSPVVVCFTPLHLMQ